MSRNGRGRVATVLALGAVVAWSLSMSGCTDTWLNRWLADSMDPAEGELHVAGLAAPASIRRDELGIPYIEAESTDDLAFAIGWAMANDRLAQMLGFTLAAQGRLAEMAGEVALPMDVYARTLGLRDISRQQLAASSDELQHMLQRFSDGVNAWLAAYGDNLPLDLRLGGFEPEPWAPINSVDAFTMINLGLGVNLHEEIMALNLAARVGTDRLPWLVPVYPDEPLPFDEAEKLEGLDLARLSAQTHGINQARAGFEQMLMPQGLAASNNWVVAPSHSSSGKSLLANDTHLLISQPPMWMLMHVRTPDMEAAGVALAGIPIPVLGFNGDVAWGATMVMGDAQDLFIEKLRKQDGELHYLADGDWLPVIEREEVFRVQGGDEVIRTIRSTRHGPLLDSALDAPPISPVVPPRLIAADPDQDGAEDEVGGYGLAFAWTAYEQDQTMDAMFRLSRAASLTEARAHLKDVRFIHLNMVLADADAAGWQVTGRYPLRRAGTGQFPSPGWDGAFSWQGFADVADHPADFELARGFVGTANHRTVEQNYPLNMSHSWFYPQRGERIDELLASRPQHDAAHMVAMQADRHDRFVPALQAMLAEHRQPLNEAIQALPGVRREHAQQALSMLEGFDGEMTAESAEAALYGAFFHTMTRKTFLDELGPEDSPAWQAFTRMTLLSYSAPQDHLLQRHDSPFWNNVDTEKQESKWDILALSLAEAWVLCRDAMGRDTAEWSWGQLHQYRWQTAATQMKPWLPRLQRWGVSFMGSYLDRGPYPAGGNHNTLNVAGSALGQDFDVHSIPAMRMVVDFGAEEPLQLVNSGGQSGNPASPHYDDGIDVWLGWGNRTLPFDPVRARAHYHRVLTLQPVE
ncbi:MAG: penicillin acylase family protein [Alcanivorax sp.]|nr:penicillin acylase family protein [Alcanivorax sp.]